MEVITEVNQQNKKLYESKFICTEEYKHLEPNWFPDINEECIHEHQDDGNGHYTPATPIGYRKYEESRKEGLDALMETEPSLICTSEEFDEMVKKKEFKFKKYDHIDITKTKHNHYIVVGSNQEGVLVAKKNKDGEYQTYIQMFEDV